MLSLKMPVLKRRNKMKGNINKGKGSVSIKHVGIQSRLMFSFVSLFIVSMLVISTIIYIISGNAIRSKVTSSSESIIGQATFNTRQRLNSVENIVGKFNNDKFIKDIEKLQSLTDPLERYEQSKLMEEPLNKVSASNNSVSNIAILYKDGQSTGTLPSFINGDNYKDVRTNFVKIGEDSQGKYIWVNYSNDKSSETTVNTKMNTLLLKGIYSKDTNKCIGVIVAFFNNTAISETYKQIDLGTNSEIFSMNEEGRLITSKSGVEINKEYISKEFIRTVLDYKRKGKNSFKFSDSEGEKLIIFSKVSGTDMYNIASIPVSSFDSDSRSIGILMGLIEAISLVLAIFVSIIISRSITIPLKKFVEYIDAAGKGDLSIRINDSSKDEIGVINHSFNEMLKKISLLIAGLKDLSYNINSNSRKIDELSRHSNLASEQIAMTMEQISRGAQDQAEGVGDGVKTMEELSGGINKITDKMSGVSEAIVKTKKVIEESMEIIKELNNRSEETNKFSEEIVGDINELNNDMQEIKEITGLIMNISKQTNLLSLNAAIEASRAGQAGRGFSVVADEVRRLADQSKDASISISNIINEIRQKTENAVSEASEAAAVVKEQMTAVEYTNNSFTSIYRSMNDVNENIEKMKKAADNVLKLKDSTMMIMEEISAVSQETVSITENVSASTQEQITGIHQLAELIELLANLANELNNSIEKFKME